MNWKLKSAIQRACASVPVPGHAVYYALQRGFNRKHIKPDPLEMLEACAKLVERLREAQVDVAGARVMEVGTGRRLDMPIGFYLAGAASTITFDLHRYLKPGMVMLTLDRIRQNREAVLGYFGPAIEERLNALCSITQFPDLLKLTGIEYRAPADASKTGLPDRSIDIQISYTVLEHIPGPVLVAILREANRILAPQGVALHHIDLSDHFEQQDPSISAINFLQFSEEQWRKYGANQFAYHNRLRVGSYAEIYRESGHEILQWNPSIDRRSQKVLKEGFPLDAAFRDTSPEDLCTTVLHVLSRPART
jgi:SAM-dependent methyltransferase